ncbi:E3 ubiquitin-protein ligase Praja-2 isoform X5 [Chelonoidis abingdonii]|nr:E3 ubiquitin-protein ligase Praja-2 isoform X4 [Chelonoidis abingdonii]XP_032618496.1 E3 ubiquitin-protein ligase Praja-2 isoform X4 [Chelonoidis abingdonii]XP_032618497.1 E3 ubiquitin-protein ligase Praja-2 isoform X4 [Chelonoidis abingdonii]XP_032618498.1 E3 ubiquitin-protein ligase Praja-2 isoform X4 [Chelonoidis abingdonii]XP_032618499.1 E3 ubiquitin-protein ligase Praja-2 isoform X4 [Chelonoidis abingdonii]XP_032618500.1 E3 ubiquitin-protein ligase Praja-2 isoform X4 [Chelonoidis abing
MGQEAGKPAWPKPAGGYQTITGRRYGRRHAYVSFRPSLMNQDRNSSQQNGECEGLELDDVQKEKSLCPSPLVQVCSALSDEPSLQNGGSEVPVCRTVLRQTVKTNTSPFSPVCYNQEGNQTSRSSMNPDKIPEDCSEYTSGECSDLNGQNGIAFVNIDSYEPDSSDGEDDGGQVDFSLAKEEAGLFQETLDHMLSELEKEVESFSGIQSRLSTFNHNASREVSEEQGPVPSMRYYSIDSDLGHRNNRTFKKSPAEDEVIGKNNLSGSASCETQQRKIIADVAIRTPVGTCNELNTSDGKTDQGNSPELVVRPKVRKQNTTNLLDRKKLTSDDEAKSSTRRRSEIFEAQQGSAEHALRNSKEKMNSSMFFDPRDYEGAQKKTENDLKSNVTTQERTSVVDDSAFWDEFEDCSRHLPGSNKDEDSSECSDGEWSACLPSYFAATEKDQSSSDESWETLPGREEREPELQSNSSGLEEENTDFCFQGGEQTSLEEGEIPWLQYHEEIESSSDEENDPVSHFVHPGFFMLDGNNNLEDDSSVSEDLDMEWRLLDEFGDGLGVAQAISYVDPQFLTYMALEERLAQAMEVTSMFMEMTYHRLQTALAHLESLAVDVEQAHPPASKESIDCLPQIITTENHNAVGQEQCCAICCSEYVKDEIITELPCHHFFHKPCVTLWLQKSGTCPVCRHVLAPVLPEAAAAATSFLSDHDSPPSVHSAAGTQ